MKTLVLNSGSSSLKFQLIDPNQNILYAKGLVENIGSSNAVLKYKAKDKGEIRETTEIQNHGDALQVSLNLITDKTRGVLKDVSEIKIVGHRIVHGGEKFSSSEIVTESVCQEIEKAAAFAPLHNPAHLKGIRACTKIIKNVKQVVVFDTAYHQNIPEYAYLYGLPYAVYEKLKIRRYGFHGTSHAYVARKAAEVLNIDFNKFNAINCHLGNGASLCAIKNGVSIDTSMGFTPLEGLIMGTRCGDLDPAIVSYLMQRENLSPEEIDVLMNKSSGLKGITKTTHDMREIEEEAIAGSRMHQLAIDMYCYRIKKYIGAYIAITGQIDALIFTAGVGENSPYIRNEICKHLGHLGISIDKEKNESNGLIIGDKGPITVMAIPTNEELAIAQEAIRVVKLEKEKLNEIESQKMRNEMIDKLTESEKASIAILWSKHNSLPIEKQLSIIKQEKGIDFTPEIFNDLLNIMGLQQTGNLE